MVRKTVPVNRADKDFGTFGGRLWAERDRLGFKQADLCARLGVSKTTQIQYEQNKSRPSVDYLVELDGIGFDLMYLLTGVRGGDGLSAEHQNLLEAYDDAPEPLKAAVFGVLLAPHNRHVSSARAVPGWYRHELAGENDVRYQQATQPPRVLHDSPAKPLPGEFIQRPEPDDAASGEG